MPKKKVEVGDRIWVHHYWDLGRTWVTITEAAFQFLSMHMSSYPELSEDELGCWFAGIEVRGTKYMIEWNPKIRNYQYMDGFLASLPERPSYDAMVLEITSYIADAKGCIAFHKIDVTVSLEDGVLNYYCDNGNTPMVINTDLVEQVWDEIQECKAEDKRNGPKAPSIEIPLLQGAMQARAEELYPGISKRFMFSPDGSGVIIHDLVTDTDLRVGLCNYHGALAVLKWLFPEPKK